MSLLTSSYRTGVLNDFSIVSKAIFWVFQKSTDILSGNHYTLLSIGGQLPVQINPDSIESKAGPTKYDLFRSLGNGQSETQGNRESEENTLSLSLTYDIYDEYSVRTMDGFLSGLGTIGGDMSLANDNTTTLNKLISLANDSEKYVLFDWGQMAYFGSIQSVSSTYTAFSRWGDPLKATATVVIRKQPLYKDPQKTQEVLPLESDKLSMFGKGEIAAYRKSDKAVNLAALGASQALR